MNQKAMRAALIQLLPSCVRIGCDASAASFTPSSDSLADPPTRVSKLVQVNPALSSIASENVLTRSMSVAVRAAASIPESASPASSAPNASSPRATAVCDRTRAAKASRPKSARSSDDALFVVSVSASTLGEAIEGEADTTSSAGDLADISSSAGLSTGFAAPGAVSAGGASCTGFVLGPAARDARLPFDSIPLILVRSSRAPYCVAQSQK